jgi:hypothetical protein
MSPWGLWGGIAAFLISLAVHVALWRLRSGCGLRLLITILAAPAAVLLLLPALGGPWSAVDSLAAALLHAALASAYLQTYPAVQAMSPSLRIVLLLERAGPAGMTFVELLDGLGRESLLGERIRDLLDAGMVRETPEGALKLELRARMLLAPITAVRRVLGLAPGKG